MSSGQEGNVFALDLPCARPCCMLFYFAAAFSMTKFSPCFACLWTADLVPSRL